MNDYERAQEAIADAISAIDAIDGIDPDIETLVNDARDALQQAQTLTIERTKD